MATCVPGTRTRAATTCPAAATDGGGGSTSTLRVYLHHGHGGGKLAGGKALTMERTLLTTECDLALMGHVHSSIVVPGAVQGVDGAGKPVLRKRRGAYTGTFLRHAYEGQDTYSEIKGYLPGVTDHIEVHLRPGADHPDDRLRLMTGGYEALSVGD